MREWKSRINGKQIREAIKEGDSNKILQVLTFELKLKAKREKDEDVKYQLEDLISLIDSDLSLSNDELTKWLEESNMTLKELVDDRLSQFYDLCDRFDIWVTV